jgi:hypothetical protein
MSNMLGGDDKDVQCRLPESRMTKRTVVVANCEMRIGLAENK